MSASSMWNVAETDFPAHGSTRQRLGFALKYASLAPTGLKWPGWESRLADAHIDLRAREDLPLEAIDPDGRELMIGCGAALHHLKLALKHFGCLGRVELFPNLDQPALVARIHLGFGRERDEPEKLLFAAMTGARANPSHWGKPPVSEAALTALARAVAGERGWLEFAQSDMSRQRVLEVALAGEQRGRNADSSRALPTNEATGWPALRWPRLPFAFDGRNVVAPKVAIEPPHPLPMPAATLAVVKTKTDDKHGWLAAGQTMARAVLQAQALGLSWAFFNQVRRRQAREALRQGVGHKGFAQVILRFGSLMASEPFRPAPATTATATFR